MTGFNLGAGLVFLALALFGLLVRKAPGLVAAGNGADLLPPPEGQYAERLYPVLTVLLCLVAVAVRVYSFTAVPAGVNQDEAMAAVDAYALANHGTDRFGMWLPAHFEAWGYGQMSVLMSYLAVPFMWVFGLSAWSIRLPVLIVSLAGVWVLYRFAFSAFGRRMGLIVLALAAVCPWHIMQSRWALDCNLMAHFTLFGVYGLYLGIQKRRWAYIGVICMGLGMYSYGIAVYTLPVLLLALAAYTLLKRLYRIRDVLLCAGVFLAVSWPIILTMMINAFDWETIALPFVTMARFEGSVRSHDLLFFAEDLSEQFGKNLGSLSRVLTQGKEAPWNAIEGFGTLYGFSVYLLALALAIPAMEAILRLRRQSRRPSGSAPDAPVPNAGSAMMWIWLGVSVLSGLMVNGVNVNRVNHIFYPLILLSALGAQRLTRLGPRGTGMTLAAVYGLAFCLFLGSYFGDHAETMAWYNFNGFGESVARAEDLMDETGAEHAAISIRNLYDESKVTTEILTMFHARIDALYYQGKANEDGKLPYAERYNYVSFDEEPPASSPDTVYIFYRTQKNLFSDGEYMLEAYGDYGVAIPLTLNRS